MIIDEVTIRQQLHQKHSSSDLWRLVRAFASCSLLPWCVTRIGLSQSQVEARPWVSTGAASLARGPSCSSLRGTSNTFYVHPKTTLLRLVAILWTNLWPGNIWRLELNMEKSDSSHREHGKESGYYKIATIYGQECSTNPIKLLRDCNKSSAPTKGIQGILRWGEESELINLKKSTTKGRDRKLPLPRTNSCTQSGSEGGIHEQIWGFRRWKALFWFW